MQQAPALFISHGPPAIALSDWPAARFLRQLGAVIGQPQAVLCVSAHWETVSPQFTDGSGGELIYDIGGPPSLFDWRYHPPAAEDWVRRLADALHQHRLPATFDPERGLDHGVWIPLRLIYPSAEIPVIQLSLQTDMQAAHHLAVGAALAPLRREGLLILGSGGSVHNLDEMAPGAETATPKPFALAFDAWLETVVAAGDLEALVDFRNQAPHAERSHPYPAEHFVPLLVAAGAAEGRPGELLHRSFLYGSLSMAAYRWA
ncbi:MAG: class III extradiol ring-cleavage dioxygenase [Desulfosarcinaceae bacterium]|nr:class III extradiol ring-cleavage dioxygenase [Desulfosarcinaceae bacterium]